MTEDRSLKKRVDLLYHGRSRAARRFRFFLMLFDVAVLSYFISTIPLGRDPRVLMVDTVMGGLLLIDFAIRLWISGNRVRMLRRLESIADFIVIGSLLLTVLIPHNLALLRIVRLFRLIHSYHVIRDLRRDWRFFRMNEDVIMSTVNLIVFVFAVTALVFVLQFDNNPQIETYLDALYFTVTTLTTTGFGDITLTGTTGRLLAVFIMLVGVGLFLRLVRALFRPQKVHHTCKSCGLNRHDPDAVHCKHCGVVLNIETEGES